MRITDDFTLSALPLSLRVLFSCFLITVGIGYLSALFLLFTSEIQPYRAMGLGLVQGIAAKYHGQRDNTRLESALKGSMYNTASPADIQKIVAWIQAGATRESYPVVKSIFDQSCASCHSGASAAAGVSLTTYEEIAAVAKVDTGPSLGELAQVSHVHLFGISIIVLITGAIFSLGQLVPAKWRWTIVALPFVAIWADVGSWWMTKFEPVFAYVVFIGGGLMGLSLALQILIPLWEMWIVPCRNRRAVASSDQ